MPAESITDDLKNVNWELVIRHLNFAEAAKALAVQTETPIDDFIVAQFADGLQEAFLRLFRKSFGTADEPETVAMATSRRDRRKAIQEAADALGVKLSPTLLLILVQFAWPIIQAILERLKANQPA